MRIKLLILSLLCFVSAQASDSTQITSRVSLEFEPAFVPGTSHYLRGDNYANGDVNHEFSIHAKYAFSFPTASRQWRFYPGAYQGIGLSTHIFGPDGKTLGTPVGLYIFQGAPFLHRGNFTLGYEWNFGATAPWKNSNAEVPTINGSPVNAYISLALQGSWQIASHWQLTAALEASHYSNGNTRLPNGGINNVGLRLGATYLFSDTPAAEDFQPSNEGFRRGFSYDILAYGSWRRKQVDIDGAPVILDSKFGVAGISGAVMYDFHRLFRAGVGVDARYDESAGIMDYLYSTYNPQKPIFERPPFHKSTSAGISAHAEYVMPIFTIAVGFGRYLVGPAETRKFYQTLMLKTHLTGPLYLAVGYELHNFNIPNNLILGLACTLH